MSSETSPGPEHPWPSTCPDPPGHRGPEETYPEPSSRGPKRQKMGVNDEPAMAHETGLMRDGVTVGHPRFIGSASGIHFIRVVSDALARVRPGISRMASGDLVPGEDDQLLSPELFPASVNTPTAVSTARAPFWRDNEVISDASSGQADPHLGQNMPTFDDLVVWTQPYFDNWHSCFPFLHGPEVLDLFENVAQVGLSNVSEPNATIVRALVSISHADARQSGKAVRPRPASFLFLSQADTASGLVFAMESPASVKGVQVALCVQLFLISMLRFNMASRLGGVIVRMAFHLGLHRCPGRYANFSGHEAMMRKRIWWSLYSLERMVSQSLGHPLSIRDDDIDVCPPTYEHHHKNSAQASARGQEQGGNQLILFGLLSDHARLRGSILELRNKSIAQRNETQDQSMIVQSELTRWVNQVNEALCEDEEEDADSRPESPHHLSSSQRVLLAVVQHEATIALHRPLLASKTNSPSSRAALQTCIGASRAIIDTVFSYCHQQSEATTLNAMVWPLLTWSIWMSSYILVFAALEDATPIPSAFRYAKKARHILKQLSRRGTQWPDFCLQALAHLVSVLQSQEPSGSRTFGSDSGRASTSNHEPEQPRQAMSQIQSSPTMQSSTTPTRRGLGYTQADFPPPAAPSFQQGTTGSMRPLPTPQTTSTSNDGGLPLGHPGLRPQDPSMSAETAAATSRPNPGAWAAPFDFDPLSAIDFSNFSHLGLLNMDFESWDT
ncbi:fungal-specific transcription factor domain-containing protein [Microdochium trichocladiopsis]|uniref:Fungal-specific transcription factor domain-containing protein n=1 Tax=Microdochium trichocladiopsis TaxID=1682393 RepID=A0A9P8XXN7_9PEZI|nr:fungal-specific transcription factor domain-containing protein [Microdochium trichocladiopsis]KAH7024485.1 fungal-specific transcription factor domain-containing protein [Microdochium trichocladiopsis]